MLKVVVLINLCYHFSTGRTIVLKFLTPWCLTDSSKMKKLVLLLIKLTCSKFLASYVFSSSKLFFFLCFYLLMLNHVDIERNPGPLAAYSQMSKSWPIKLTVKISEKKHKQLKISLNDFGPKCIYDLTENWLASYDSNIFIIIIPINLISIDVIERMKKEEDNFYSAKDLHFRSVLYLWKPLSWKQIIPSQKYLDQYFLQSK